MDSETPRNGENGEISLVSMPKRLVVLPLSGLTPFPMVSTILSFSRNEFVEEIKKDLFFIATAFVRGDSIGVQGEEIGVLSVVNKDTIVTQGNAHIVPVNFIARTLITDVKTRLEVNNLKIFECIPALSPGEKISSEAWDDVEFQKRMATLRDLLTAFSGEVYTLSGMQMNRLGKFAAEDRTRAFKKFILRKSLSVLEGALQRLRDANRDDFGTCIDTAAALLGGHLSGGLVDDITSDIFWGKSRDVLRGLDVMERAESFTELLNEARELVAAAGEFSPDDSTAINEDSLPENVREEIKKLLPYAQANPPTAESVVAQKRIEWLRNIPWTKRSEDKKDFVKIEAILEEDHCGLEEVKERISEFIAVRRSKPDAKGSILCLVGPPGVGKTSLGKSVARAMGRKFVRLSLGGIHDEAEIRGHRSTYVGALPGQIMQAMRRAGTKNPVFMLDEIDKIGSDFRGDPASALLEVLDPEQNHAFRDNYLDQPFDLSEVFFILTANTVFTIPLALLNRMEVIELPAYTEEEKMEIAFRHIIPKVTNEFGISEENLQAKEIPVFSVEFEKKAVQNIVSVYTHDAGMRNSERAIQRVLRKILRVAEKKQLSELTSDNVVKVTPELLLSLLGEPKQQEWLPGLLGKLPVGTSVGMSIDGTGQGGILAVEVSLSTLASPNEPVKIKRTGSLHPVMKESIGVAVDRLNKIGGVLEGMANGLFVRIHVPDGAIPKDGPSAGVAEIEALYSAILSFRSGKSISAKPFFAATGEITLNMDICAPIGGVTAKLLGARRAGIREAAIPYANRRDIKKVPAGWRIITPEDRDGKSWKELSLEEKPEGSFTVYCVERPEDVLELAFPNDYPPRKQEEK
ncbi:MAG: S16 family serine protease [Patescibacteria group bacterium]